MAVQRHVRGVRPCRDGSNFACHASAVCIECAYLVKNSECIPLYAGRIQVMKILPSKHFCRRSASPLTNFAFTLTELLVVIVMLAILAAVLMPILASVRTGSMLASCANNLRQLGVGCNIYATENGGYLPVLDWPLGNNPWETSQACRVSTIPGSTILQGPYNFALLYFASIVQNPLAYYCPAVSTGFYSYSSFSGPGYPWPSISPYYTQFGNGNAYVRTGYNYYPESKQTQTISDQYGTFTLPALIYANNNGITITFNPPGAPPNTINHKPTQLKITQVNLNKAMGVDQLTTWALIQHDFRGQPYGLNAVFPDGHVRLQPVIGNNKLGSNEPFDPELWDPDDIGSQGPSQDPDGFRIIMNGFKP
jgi:prepilin-type N-terminal cleavage/methylation domain-containing protein